MKSKCTLIVDGNWLLMNKLHVGGIKNFFDMKNSKAEKEEGTQLLVESLAQSISYTLRKFTGVVDNIIFVQDGGSWRKSIDPPIQLGDADYKGTRTKSTTVDWKYIFAAADKLSDNLGGVGIQVSQTYDIEGDDWAYYWSEKLLLKSTNVIIWTIDNDLKQLVKMRDGNFVAWFQNKQGLFLSSEFDTSEVDDLDMFMRVDVINSTLELLKSKFVPTQINYIEPWKIVIEKIIAGDSGDNILPIYNWKIGNKNHRVTPKRVYEMIDILKLRSVEDLIDGWEKVNDYFLKLLSKKQLLFKDKITDHFQHNLQMVWLNELAYPFHILDAMEKAGEPKFCGESIIKDISQNLHTISQQANQKELDEIFTEMDKLDDFPF